MVATIQSLLPYGVLASHVVFIIVLFAFIFRKSWGKDIAGFVGKHSIFLALLASLAAIVGSLFYSELVGFEPCVLCWWQRVFLYPQAVIFGVALWRRDTSPFLFAVPLVSLSALLSLYHSYVYMGGQSILPCTALGGACSKVYVMEFGYITIPMMSLTISLSILLLAWAHKLYSSHR